MTTTLIAPRRPKITRDGLVAMPTAWNVLAWAALSDGPSSAAAGRELAKQVLGCQPNERKTDDA